MADERSAPSSAAHEVTHFSIERENFQKLCDLLHGCNVLLREEFDLRIPPSVLPVKLQDSDVKTRLKTFKLTIPQWRCLYPSPGLCGTSEDFDISLLIILFQALCMLPSPVTSRKDSTFMEAVMQIRRLRNFVFHSKGKISEDDFPLLWKAISAAMLKIAGEERRSEWQIAIDNLLKGPTTLEEENKMEAKTSLQEFKAEVVDRLDRIEEKLCISKDGNCFAGSRRQLSSDLKKKDTLNYLLGDHVFHEQTLCLYPVFNSTGNGSSGSGRKDNTDGHPRRLFAQGQKPEPQQGVSARGLPQKVDTQVENAEDTSIRSDGDPRSPEQRPGPEPWFEADACIQGDDHVELQERQLEDVRQEENVNETRSYSATVVAGRSSAHHLQAGISSEERSLQGKSGPSELGGVGQRHLAVMLSEDEHRSLSNILSRACLCPPNEPQPRATKHPTENWNSALENQMQSSPGDPGAMPTIQNAESTSTFLNLSYDDYRVATNDFAKERSLGKGGQGEVFKGRHGEVDFAVKRLTTKIAFEREKKMLRCRHPFTMPLWGTCKNGNEFLVVYPLMEDNLFNAIVVEKTMCDYKKRIQLSLQLSCGLKYLHDQGIIYRDFKSQNVLLHKNNPRLGDFGLVKQIQDDSSDDSGTKTSTFVIEGTSGYYCNIATHNPKNTQPEMDLHGLGVVMMELLTGMPGSEDGTALYYKLGIDSKLNKPDEAVQIIFSNSELVEKIHEAGWPVGKEHVAKKFAELAVRCVNRNSFEDRIPLHDLCRELKVLYKQEKEATNEQQSNSAESQVSFYEDVGSSKCVFCCFHERDPLYCLACKGKHPLICRDCLLNENNDSLFCPQCCSEQYSLVGNRCSYGICIAGEGDDELQRMIFIKDAEAMAQVLEERMRIPKDNVKVLTPDAMEDTKRSTSQNIRAILGSFKRNVEDQKMKEKEFPESQVIPTTVVVVMSGHGKKGFFALPGKEELDGNSFMRRLKEINADHTVAFLDFCNAEMFAFVAEREISSNAVHVPSTGTSELPLSSSIPQSVESEDSSESRWSLSSIIERFWPTRSNRTSNSVCPLKRVIASTELFKGTFVGVYSCGRNQVSTFNPKELENSDFIKNVISAFNGAEKCYGGSGAAEQTICSGCDQFRRKTGYIGFIELTDLTDYVSTHLKSAGLTEPTVQRRDAGRRLLLAKACRN